MGLNKTLVIYDSIQYFVPFIRGKGVKCFPSFKKVGKINRIFRLLSLKTGVGESIWYGDWKKYAGNADTVIIFATNRYDFIEYMAEQFSHLRIIVWYWNPVFACFQPDKLNKRNIEFWSFDEDDCRKYNLKFNTTFYLDNIIIDEDLSEKFDIVFLGADKKRKIILEQINKDLIAAGAKTLFHIVPDRDQPNPQNIKPLPYVDYLKLLAGAKCILDYVQEGQAGNTVRTMESIFFKKKLITNDLRIKNESFYDSSNIFVLGHDNFDNIIEFISTPYKILEDEIVNYYDFSTWLKRFTSHE